MRSNRSEFTAHAGLRAGALPHIGPRKHCAPVKRVSTSRGNGWLLLLAAAAYVVASHI